MQICSEGVLARGQQMVNARVEVSDVKYHADAKHRAPSHVVPAANTAITAALLSAGVRLVEPLVCLDVSAPSAVANAVYRCLHRRHAVCGAADVGQDRGFVRIGAVLAVTASLGLAAEMRGATKGQAFPSISPAGWRTQKVMIQTNKLIITNKLNTIFK